MSLQIHHFKSNGGTVTMVGSGTVWEGYQAEIDYFSFHGERLARFAGQDVKPVIAYQADGHVYGFRHLADGFHGALGELNAAPTSIVLREIMEDLS
jgi:hypothetical protein